MTVQQTLCHNTPSDTTIHHMVLKHTQQYQCHLTKRFRVWQLAKPRLGCKHNVAQLIRMAAMHYTISHNAINRILYINEPWVVT